MEFTINDLKEHCEKVISPENKVVFDVSSRVYQEHKMILDLIQEYEHRNDYKAQIRAEVIDEYHKEMHAIIEGNEEFTDWQKYEILECNELVAEQLKEQE